MKLGKYENITYLCLHFARPDGQDGKNRKENQATKVTKIQKNQKTKIWDERNIKFANDRLLFETHAEN
jgi:hypothetical protein